MPIQRLRRAAGAARGLAPATLALALSVLPLSARPSYADVITLTETGFTGGGVLAGGTLVATFTGTSTGGPYELKDLTAASVDYTVEGTLIYTYALANLVEFTFAPGSSAFSFKAESYHNSDMYLEGEGSKSGGTEIGEGHINSDGPTSKSPFTISVVSDSPGLGSPSPVPEPSTWILLGAGAATIALARGRRKTERALV